METFQKIETVEARKYEGPRITVVSDKFGEQVANSGDYLIGTKRGEVHVVPASTFEAEFKPYTDTPEAEQLAAAQAQTEAEGHLKAIQEAQAVLKAETQL
jgi:hypothetical protein